MKDVKRLKVGVAGVGHLGRHHARILGGLPACEMVGVFDADRTTAERVAGEHGLPLAASLEELIERAEALSIATPTVTHHAVAARALDCGRHVLVEKPIAPTLAEADDLLARAARRGVTLQVGHVERFNGAILAVRDLVAEPRFIEVHRLSPFPARSTDVGVVLDVMIHDIDLLLSLTRSKVARIDAIGAAIVTAREDIANARLTFESGCVANVTASRVSARTLRKIRIFTPERYLSIDCHKQEAEMWRKAAGAERSGAAAPLERLEPQVEKTEPLRLELEAFVASCLGSGPRAATGEEGREALAVALEIVRLIAARPA